MNIIKRLFSLMIITTIILSSIYTFAETSSGEPDTESENVLLLDNNSGRIIYDKNGGGRIEPGGFTKILTAVIVLENVNDIKETVTADSKAVNAYDFSLNNMGVLPGEKMSVENLLYGMLMYDAGEAANALAVYVGESMDKFVEKMNAKAADLGCSATNFTNPSGMHDEQQYSSLADIAKIVNHAMSNQTFAQIVSTRTHTISPTNKYPSSRHLNNSNKFLVSKTSPYYNPSVTGVKTSYISNDDCGIAVTYVNGSTSLLCLIANAKYRNGVNQANEDTKKLIEYGTNYYVPHQVMNKDDIMAEVKITNGKEADRVLLIAPETMVINLPKGFDESKLEVKIDSQKKVKAPITKGDALGQVTVMYNGEKYATSILSADSTITSSPIKGIMNSITSFFTSWIFITSIIAIIVLFVVYTILLNRAKRKRSYVSRFR